MSVCQWYVSVVCVGGLSVGGLCRWSQCRWSVSVVCCRWSVSVVSVSVVCVGGQCQWSVSVVSVSVVSVSVVCCQWSVSVVSVSVVCVGGLCRWSVSVVCCQWYVSVVCVGGLSVGGLCRWSVSVVDVCGQCQWSVSVVSVSVVCCQWYVSVVCVGGQCQWSVSVVSVSVVSVSVVCCQWSVSVVSVSVVCCQWYVSVVCVGGLSVGGLCRWSVSVVDVCGTEAVFTAGCAVKDYGNLTFEEVVDDGQVGVVKHVQAVGGANQSLSEAVQKVKTEGNTPVMLGGDDSLAIGSIHGHVGGLSVVWVDAHADINTPLSTPTGNLHGQAASYLIQELQAKIPNLPGFSWLQPCVGARDLVYMDPQERHILKLHGVKVSAMPQVDQLGIARVMEETCDYLLARKPIHLSYDIDAIDGVPFAVTWVKGTPAAGGLTYKEGLYITECLCETGLLSAVDLVEVNPLRGQNEQEVQFTVSTAVDLLLGCYGCRREGNLPLEYVLPEP
ncbi:arginase-1-like [Antennarius striatus]|uniref:arginase-1-like n=1 Tax=Antennarius striatus TaxID=241820 RepID=UPI0035B378B4